MSLAFSSWNCFHIYYLLDAGELSQPALSLKFTLFQSIRPFPFFQSHKHFRGTEVVYHWCPNTEDIPPSASYQHQMITPLSNFYNGQKTSSTCFSLKTNKKVIGRYKCIKPQTPVIISTLNLGEDKPVSSLHQANICQVLRQEENKHLRHNSLMRTLYVFFSCLCESTSSIT